MEGIKKAMGARNPKESQRNEHTGWKTGATTSIDILKPITPYLKYYLSQLSTFK